MRIVRDLLLVSISNVVVIIVGFIYNPLLVRFFGFSPDVFGLFQQVVSQSTIISSYFLLSLNVSYNAEVREHSSDDHSRFFSQALMLLILTTVGSVVVMDAFMSIRKLELLIVTLSQGLYIIVYTIYRDDRSFKAISVGVVVRSLTNSLLGLVLAYSLPDERALIYAFIFSYTVVSAYLLRKYLKVRGLVFWFSLRGLGRTLRKNSNIVVFQTILAFLNSVSFNTPVLLIESVFGASILGFYSIAYRLLAFANQFLTKALSDTFLPYISKSKETRTTLFDNFSVMAAGFGLLYFTISRAATFFVGLLYGESFLLVADIIRIISPWLYSQACVSPFTAILQVEKKAHIGLILTVAFLTLRVMTILNGGDNPFLWTMAAFSAVSVMLYVSFFVFSFRLSKTQRMTNKFLVLAANLSMLFASATDYWQYFVPVLLWDAYLLKPLLPYLRRAIASRVKRG